MRELRCCIAVVSATSTRRELWCALQGGRAREDTSPVRLFYAFLKSPASHQCRHCSHQLRSAVDRAAGKLPVLRPLIAFARR